ncbi:MAG: lipid A deacylase LpxR family protein [Bacteroidota bacterium]
MRGCERMSILRANFRILWLGCLCLFTFPLSAQDVSKATYIRMQWENDLLKIRLNDVTDRFYTNGLQLDVFTPIFSKIPSRFLLIKLGASSQHMYGLSIGQEIYTPTDLTTDSILRGDRPYAGWFHFSHRLISNDPLRQQRLSTQIQVGFMGRWSLASELQRGIHRLFKNSLPQGWRNQIANDIGLSYYAKYEKRFFRRIHEKLDIIQHFEGQVSTVSNFIGLGSRFRLGRFNDYFQNPMGLSEKRIEPKLRQALIEQQAQLLGIADLPEKAQKKWINLSDPDVARDSLQQMILEEAKRKTNKKFQLYYVMEPSFRLAFNNALMQGGIFGKDNSPHTLSADKLRRYYFNLEFGIVIGIRGLEVSFSQFFRSKEFDAGESQRWGRVRLTIGLND